MQVTLRQQLSRIGILGSNPSKASTMAVQSGLGSIKRVSLGDRANLLTIGSPRCVGPTRCFGLSSEILQRDGFV